MIVARHDEASKGYEYKYVDSGSSRMFSEYFIELKGLPAGKYVIFAKFDWIRKSVETGTVSLYTESKVSIRKSSQSAHGQFLFKTFLDHSRKNVKKQVIS